MNEQIDEDEPAEWATLCTCGHKLRDHSQLSTGCYAIAHRGCPCGGFIEAKP